MGHSQLETTMGYLHAEAMGVQSPLAYIGEKSPLAYRSGEGNRQDDKTPRKERREPAELSPLLGGLAAWRYQEALR